MFSSEEPGWFGFLVFEKEPPLEAPNLKFPGFEQLGVRSQLRVRQQLHPDCRH